LPKLCGLVVNSKPFAHIGSQQVFIHEILWNDVPPPAIGSTIQCWILEENLELLHESTSP
jgi:hypothetical protein